MSGWTEEKRQAERDRINQTKPWLKSTGAKTPEGKAICAQNARKLDLDITTLKTITNTLFEKHMQNMKALIKIFEKR